MRHPEIIVPSRPVFGRSSLVFFLRNPFAAVLTDMAERPKGYGMTAELKEKVSNRTSKFACVSACGVTLRRSVVAAF